MAIEKTLQAYREAETKLWKHYAIQPEEYFLELAQPELRVRIQEFGEGSPLLFLHGSPSSGTTWAPLVAKLPDYRCILLDLPGFGLSDPVDYGSRDTKGLVTDILDSVLSALALDSVALVASSSGGTKAYWYALARPQRVSRMVQLGAPFVLEGAPIQMTSRLMAIPKLNHFLVGLLPVNLKAMRNIYDQIGHGPAVEDGRIPTCFLEWSVQLSAETGTMASTVNLVEACMTWRGIRPQAMIGREELGRIRQPTQYIWSEGDPEGGAPLARETAQRTPHSELHLLPGDGHLPWLDSADAVAELMRNFLQPIRASEGASVGNRLAS